MIEKWKDALHNLDYALCQFLNNAEDAYDPELWHDSVRRDFKVLCEAYNEAHVAGLMDILEEPEIIKRLRELEETEWMYKDLQS